jgi:hypothetical protein
MIAGALICPPAFASEDPGNDDAPDMISEVYRDMIVVQRKAKNKAGKALFSMFVDSEFSDGPEAINAMNFSLGYALSDRWEVYANAAPLFFLQDRQIKKSVQELQLLDGSKANLISPDPKIQYGLDIYWLPAYGKDSWGPHTIIRSDTFFKLSLAMVQFASGSGRRETLGIGKTFFLSRWFNPRVTASFGFHETIVNDVKANSEFGVFELGSVWYL